MGTIAVGQRADLVLLERDPLENIANTRTIGAVVSRGRLLRPEDLNGRSLFGLEVGFEDMSTPEHLHLAVVSQLDGELLDARARLLPSERDLGEVQARVVACAPLPRLGIDDEMPRLVVDAFREQGVPSIYSSGRPELD